jgi:hypothetical protein
MLLTSVVRGLRLMVGAYPGFTQSLFCGQVLSSLRACGLLYQYLDGWCHRHDHVEDDEVTHEN